MRLSPGADAAGFRDAVRRLAAAAVPPERVIWSVGEAPGLFGTPEAVTDAPALALPRGVGDLVTKVVPHRDPERYALLYTLVWRVLHGERRLLEVSSDPLVHRLERMAKAIARDLHKMHAFLRFRRVEGEGPERFVAWFEPDHHILAAAAPFFVGRFRSLHWTILTPEASARWDTVDLSFGPPGRPRAV
ncbi:TIGR03915 family putative DNA repair protein, partial [Methylobacterium adhaesivum]|uniref:TIGR03915 family putative DNA repair protein n=1 Tax=Methylobacterium adhaesivum TaxID=333297 RepID=UPI00357105FB